MPAKSSSIGAPTATSEGETAVRNATWGYSSAALLIPAIMSESHLVTISPVLIIQTLNWANGLLTFKRWEFTESEESYSQEKHLSSSSEGRALGQTIKESQMKRAALTFVCQNSTDSGWCSEPSFLSARGF